MLHLFGSYGVPLPRLVDPLGYLLHDLDIAMTSHSSPTLTGIHC